MFPRSRQQLGCSRGAVAVGRFRQPCRLPPPSEPTITASTTEGLVRFQGGLRCCRRVRVFAFGSHSNSDRGQHTESGQYDFTMAALRATTCRSGTFMKRSRARRTTSSRAARGELALGEQASQPPRRAMRALSVGAKHAPASLRGGEMPSAGAATPDRCRPRLSSSPTRS